MSSLLDKIRADKAARLASGIRAPEQKATVVDISLRGTGLTKREAEKNQRQYDRDAAKSEKVDKTLFVAAAEQEFESGIQATIAEMLAAQAKGEFEYDASQIRAIAGIKHNKVSVLIGAAGTGKTTITKKVTSELAKHCQVVNLNDITFVWARRNMDEKPFRILRGEAIKQKLLIDGEGAAAITTPEMPGIAFAAYTGRATQQMKRALPEIWHKNASTIHSLLGYAPVMEEVEKIDKLSGQTYMEEVRRFRPSFDATCKLPFQIYVLDEASMIPIPLFNELIDAIHETSRILLIGDIHQLPPVYGKSVLGYAMRKWPVFELTTIHRQAAGNAIISNAHNVLRGRPLENADNFHLIGNTPKSPAPAGQAGLHTYMLNVIKKLHEMNRYNPYTDAIIVPQNKGLVGQTALNEKLVTMFNPEVKENGVIVNKRLNIHTGTGHVYFAPRDKVMITSNINTSDPPITNGMVGIVESININGKYDMKRSQVDFGALDDDPLDLDLDNMTLAMEGMANDEKKEKEDETDDQRQSSHVLTIKFESGQSYSCSTAGDYRRLTHGYAATCHKSQGGEYPNIIILCHSVNAVMLTQEWLYTAITRARNNVYIICNQRGLDKALARQVIKGNSLAEKIRSYVIESGANDDIGPDGEIILGANGEIVRNTAKLPFDKIKYPILWEPKELN